MITLATKAKGCSKISNRHIDQRCHNKRNNQIRIIDDWRTKDHWFVDIEQSWKDRRFAQYFQLLGFSSKQHQQDQPNVLPAPPIKMYILTKSPAKMLVAPSDVFG